MKIKYEKKNKVGVRQINFYKEEKYKKNDSGKDYFLNFKVEKDLNRRKFILLVRSVIDRVKKHKQEKISFDYSQVKDIFVEDLSDYDRAKIFVENLFIGEYKFDKYLSKKEGRISEIIIFGDFNSEEKKAFAEAEIVSLGVNQARD